MGWDTWRERRWVYFGIHEQRSWDDERRGLAMTDEDEHRPGLRSLLVELFLLNRHKYVGVPRSFFWDADQEIPLLSLLVVFGIRYNRSSVIGQASNVVIIMV